MEIFIYAAMITVVVIGFIGGAVYIAASVSIELKAKAARSQWQFLQPDLNGNKATPFHLPTGTAIEVQPGHSLPANVPTSITYSPHISTSHQAAPSLPAPIATDQPGAGNVPTFSELLDQGEIAANPNRLLLGYTEGKLISGSWLDLYSAAIGGISGSGKTTTTRFLAAQSAMMGAKFVVIDPHAEVAEESLAATLAPLSASFAFDPAVENKDIIAALWEVRQVLEKRLRTGKGTPYIVAIDEFSSLMRRGELADLLVNLLADVAQQGRKVGVFAMCIGQIWTASATGGTSDLRDSFASAFVHRMKRNQARLLLPLDESRTVERLEAGNALLSKTNGDIVQVAIPQTTAADIQRVARLISGASVVATEGHYRPIPSTGNEPETNRKSTGFEAKTLSAEDTRILSLFSSGLDIPAIVKEVHGLAGNQGAKYQTAAKEVTATIRRSIG